MNDAETVLVNEPDYRHVERVIATSPLQVRAGVVTTVDGVELQVTVFPANGRDPAEYAPEEARALGRALLAAADAAEHW